MSRIKFIKKEVGQHLEYHLPSTINGWIEESIFDKNYSFNEYCDEAWFAYLSGRGINYVGTEENALISIFVLEKLLAEYTIQMIYFGASNEVTIVQKDALLEPCEWRYSIEFGRGDALCRDFGWLNPKEFLQAVDYFNKSLRNRYFHLATIRPQSIRNFVKIFQNDVSNWSFILSKNAVVVSELLANKKERPSLERLLKVADFVVNVQMGADEGYLDYVQIISNENRDDLMLKLEKELSVFVNQYEILLLEMGKIDSVQKIETFKTRLKFLWSPQI